MLISLDYLIKKYRFQPKGVLHLGANVGEEAKAYDAAGIKNVIWIEANPELIPTLKQNVEYYGHRVFNFCVGDENKETVLHLSNNAGQSSSVLKLGTHKKHHPTVHYERDVTVHMMRIDSFFRTLPDQTEKYSLEGIDFLNADLQGFEGQALRGMGDLLNQIKWVYLEVNREYVYEGNALVGEIDQYLKGFGFKPIEEKWTKANWGDKFYSK